MTEKRVIIYNWQSASAMGNLPHCTNIMLLCKAF
jgi:hypothetical protein